MKQENAVCLNSDEIMTVLFGQYLGDRHDEILEKTLQYIYMKSLEIYQTGISVIVDFGFWQKKYRKEANAFYKMYEIKPEWHYIDISQQTWEKNIKSRNKMVQDGISNDYFVDKNIIAKFENPNDEPLRSEIDVWYKNEY
jgi:predicted kinase